MSIYSLKIDRFLANRTNGRAFVVRTSASDCLEDRLRNDLQYIT